MANYYSITTGGNWSSSSTWASSTGQSSGGAGVPTSADSVFIDSTLTSSNSSTLSCVGITLGASTGSTGSLATVIVTGTSTLTSGGYTFHNPLNLNY